MNFQSWMESRGLSESTVKKYAGAVDGSLSQWAIEGGLSTHSLTSITSRSRFDALVKEIGVLPIFVERDVAGNAMYSNALARYSEFLSENHANDIEADIETIVEDPSLPETEKAQLVKARIGQGKFREELIAFWGGCAATGFDDPSLLLASHIKPWKVSANFERLDKYNGLLLLPNLDKAFDSGFISFNDDGTIKISPRLEQADLLGIHDGLSVRLAPEHLPYFAYHRGQVFRDA